MGVGGWPFEKVEGIELEGLHRVFETGERGREGDLEGDFAYDTLRSESDRFGDCGGDLDGEARGQGTFVVICAKGVQGVGNNVTVVYGSRIL